MGLGFWHSKFDGMSQIFAEFPGWKLVFSKICKGKVTNIKIQGRGADSEKYIFNFSPHLCLDFFFCSSSFCFVVLQFWVITKLWYIYIYIIYIYIASSIGEIMKWWYYCGESSEVLSYISKKFFHSVYYKSE